MILPKTKDAFALRELAEIFSQNKLGIVVRYEFFRGDDEKFSYATQEVDDIVKLCEQYFEKKIPPAALSIGASKLQRYFNYHIIRNNIINHTISHIKRHIERLKIFEVFLTDKIADANMSFLQSGKKTWARLADLLRKYSVILDNLNYLSDRIVKVPSSIKKGLSSDEVADIIRENLRKVRLEKNITQIDAANELNITQSRLSAYERGRLVPPLSVIRDSVFVYGISLEWLFGLTGD